MNDYRICLRNIERSQEAIERMEKIKESIEIYNKMNARKGDQ